MGIIPIPSTCGIINEAKAETIGICTYLNKLVVQARLAKVVHRTLVKPELFHDNQEH